MKHIGIVFLYELRRNIRRKGYLFGTFGLPLLGFVLLFGYNFYQTNLVSQEEEPTDVLSAITLERIEQAGYVDQSGQFGTVPESLVAVLRPYDTVEEARTAMNAGEIDVFFVLAADYLETGDAVLHLPGLQLMMLDDGDALMKQLALRTFVADLSREALARLTTEPVFNEFDLTQSSENGTNEAIEGGRFLVVYVFTIVFFVGLMLTNSYLMQTVIEERENKLIEILIATVRPVNLLGGKILALGLLGMVQIAVWVISVVILLLMAGNLSAVAPILATLNLQVPAELIVVMAVFFVLMYLLYAVLFGAIGAISGSTQQGSQYVGLIVLPTILPFYFFELIQADPNGGISTVFTLIPFTAPITVMMRMITGAIPAWQLVVSMLLIIAALGAALWLAGRLFRVQTLLRGSSFRLSDLPALLFSER
jgi:ABC-2 type transport system permease protein